MVSVAPFAMKNLRPHLHAREVTNVMSTRAEVLSQATTPASCTSAAASPASTPENPPHLAEILASTKDQLLRGQHSSHPKSAQVI